VLFDGIELGAEQSRGVDAIIEAQLKVGRRSEELCKGPDECMEEMRALLSEEQRPIFDMNRARLAAEDQQPRKQRRQRRPRADAEAEAEGADAEVKAEGADAEVKAEEAEAEAEEADAEVEAE
jgi:hypothetical protein